MLNTNKGIQITLTLYSQEIILFSTYKTWKKEEQQQMTMKGLGKREGVPPCTVNTHSYMHSFGVKRLRDLFVFL